MALDAKGSRPTRISHSPEVLPSQQAGFRAPIPEGTFRARPSASIAVRVASNFVLQQSSCHYSGTPPSLGTSRRFDSDRASTTTSEDRGLTHTADRLIRLEQRRWQARSLHIGFVQDRSQLLTGRLKRGGAQTPAYAGTHAA